MESSASISYRPARRWPWWLAIATLLVWCLANLQWGRAIGWDEVEFLKATDWVRQGQVPYRDFFEHHSPLQWFLMAPFERLAHGPGVAPVLWLRWMQVPMWGVAIWRVHVWMREAGGSPLSRLLALGCLIGTPLFVFSALEYRVDTLGTLLVIMALDGLRRPGARQACLVGALLSASVVANLRFAPLVVMTALVAPLLDIEARAWRFQPRKLGAIALGGALGLLPWLLYLLATHSTADMWRWCFAANAKVSATVPATRSLGTYLLYPFFNLDLPGLLLELGVLAGGWAVLRKIRRPGFIHLLLLVQMANLAFIAAMKVQYLYHFELSLCLAAPFLACAADRIAERPVFPRLAAGVFAVTLAVNGATLASMNDHATLSFQDQALKRAAQLTPPGSTVLDGCGWMLDAKPAYRFWFLPVLARVMTLHHMAPPYTPEDFRRDPPALVIANTRLENLAVETPAIGRILTTHYLPVEPNLWVPGLSAVLSPATPVWTWTAPEEGDYQILCSPGLARHPWFSAPFDITMPVPFPSQAMAVDPATFQNEGMDQLHWRVDGKDAVPVSEAFHLAKGQSLSVAFKGPGVLGVMLPRKGMGCLFTPPPRNVTLDYITFNSYWPHS